MMMKDNNKRIIYKYELTQQGYTDITGCFSNVVHLGEQEGRLYIWLERSLTRTNFYTGKQIPRDESEERVYRFFTIGTGWTYSPADVGTHIGSAQMSNGLVWHVFMKEVKE